MDNRYSEKINIVVDYIQNHLGAELSVQQLSRVACLSKFHFGRIFKDVVGESLYQYIKRLRLEKSAGLLLTSPEDSITDIAFCCGFETSAAFSKSFKAQFKMSPTEWRKQLTDKRIFNDMEKGEFGFVNRIPTWSFKHGSPFRQVRIETLPSTKVAYVRNIGPYQEDASLFRELSEQLYQWAVPRGLITENTPVFNFYYDDPNITDDNSQRVMVAIPVSDKTEPSGSIGITNFEGGKYAICRFTLNDDEFKEAWTWIFSAWLSTSGYQLDDREAFERCYGERVIHDRTTFDVEIGIPVRAK